MADMLDYAWEALEHYGVEPEEFDDTYPELDEDWGDTDTCPECGGTGMKFGNLGKVEWYRCRACGYTYGIEEQGTKEVEE